MATFKRAVHGVISGSANFGLTLIQSVALVPLLLRKWGATEYGTWLTINAAYSLIVSLDIGHQTYVGNELNKLHHSNRTAARETLSSALLISSILGSIELLFTLYIVLAGKLSWLTGQHNTIKEGEILLVLVIAWVITGSIGGVLVRLYSCTGNFARGQWLGFVGRFLQLLALVICALSDRHLLTAAVAMSAAIVFFNGFLFVDIFRVAPSYFPWFRGVSLQLGIRNFARSTGLVAMSLLQQIGGNGLTLIVAQTLSSAAIPTFTTSRTVANVLMQAGNIVFQPIVPDMARVYVNQEWKKVLWIFMFGWLIIGICTQVGTLIIVPVLLPLYSFWTHKQLAFDSQLTFCLLTATALKSLGAPAQSLLIAVNNVREQIICAVFQVGTTLLVAIALIKYQGSAGIGIGMCFGELIGSVIAPMYYASVHLRRSNSTSLLALIIRPGLGIVIMVLSLLLVYLRYDLRWSVCFFGTFFLLLNYFGYARTVPREALLFLKLPKSVR